MLQRLQRLLRPSPPRIVEEVRAARLTYLDTDALHDLHRAVQRLERAGTNGAIIETGCALGGSAIVLAAAKRRERPLRIYDVFGMIPPPSARDGEDVHARYGTIVEGRSKGIRGDRYYGYQDDLLEQVTRSFEQFGLAVPENDVSLIAGLFEHTLHVDAPVALAHLDGDWYESTMTCLSRIVPHLVRGGSLVIDDYDHWSGCRTAVDEYFADRRGDFRFVRRARLHIVRR